jgi:carboxymethylenebutenolidase
VRRGVLPHARLTVHAVEHIWWDQAGALLQAGLLPERAPVPGASGDAMLRLPVAGAAAARLVVDETDGVSNEMLTKAWQEAL